MTAVRVRFAPSPTGELHIGGARTALFNYLYARAHNGVFVLRIDDTDRERSRPEYVQALLNALRWLKLEWDEGPYCQSDRLELYRREAKRLLAAGKAYRCYCSTEELAAEREAARERKKPYLYPRRCRKLAPEQEDNYRAEGRRPVIRLRVPEEGVTVVHDAIRGEVTFENRNLDDFIILKSDGLPTYNFASIVDDHDLSITDVIRAEEHLSNTPRQQLCADALGYRLPRFAHVPMILAPDRSKLSKRHGATAVEEFRDQGYLPAALINYLALLGWSPGEDEIITLEETVGRFSLDRVNKTAAIYDTAKLTWLNGLYLRKEPPEHIAAQALPFFVEAKLLEKEPSGEPARYFLRVVEVLIDRAQTLRELAQAATYFYCDDFTYDPAGVKKFFKDISTAVLLQAAAKKVGALDLWNASTLDAAYHSLTMEMGVAAKQVVPPTRLALTGRTVGPDLFELMAILGKETAVNRLKRAAAFIKERIE